MAENLTVSELNEVLRKNSSATTGNKADLLARLMSLDDHDSMVRDWLSRRESAKRTETQALEFENMKTQMNKLQESLKASEE